MLALLPLTLRLLTPDTIVHKFRVKERPSLWRFSELSGTGLHEDDRHKLHDTLPKLQSGRLKDEVGPVKPS